MRYTLATKTEQGFSLIEGLVVVVLVGVLAAIGTPSLVGWLNNSAVKQAANDVQGAFLEASRLSRKNNNPCSVEKRTVPGEPDRILIFSSNGCLLSNRKLPKGVQMTSNISDAIKFEADGKSLIERIVVLYKENSASRKCVFISPPLPIIRIGNYNGSVSSIDKNKCLRG